MRHQSNYNHLKSSWQSQLKRNNPNIIETRHEAEGANQVLNNVFETTKTMNVDVCRQVFKSNTRDKIHLIYLNIAEKNINILHQVNFFCTSY